MNSQYSNTKSILTIYHTSGGGDSCMRHLLELPSHRVSQRRPLQHVLVQFSSAVTALPHVDTVTVTKTHMRLHTEITHDDSVIQPSQNGCFTWIFNTTRASIEYRFVPVVIMVALCNRADHYIFFSIVQLAFNSDRLIMSLIQVSVFIRT